MNEAHIALRLDLLALCFVTFNQETAQKNIIKGRRGGVAVEKVAQKYIKSRRMPGLSPATLDGYQLG